MKFVILGSKGTLGQALVEQLKNTKGIDCYAFSHSELSIEDFFNIEKTLLKIKPDVVINASAYNAVDQAEDESSQAFLINSEAVLHLARLTQAYQIRLVHYSTDYVFDGLALEPYSEQSNVNPLSVYGKSKWLGEQACILANPQSYSLRTSVVFGNSGNNFFTRFFEMIKNKTELSMVTDLIGCPTPAKSLARTTLQLISNQADFGLYHAVGSESCSRFEFAKSIIETYGLKINLKPQIMGAHLPKANRPLKVILKNNKLLSLGIEMMSYKDGIKDIFEGTKAC